MQTHLVTAALAVVTAGYLAATSARAADISVRPPGADGLPLVIVSGTIAPSDGEAFAQKVASLTKAIVGFHSPGGHLVSGIAIGETIHAKKFSTYVPTNAWCASACAIAWLAGQTRFMGPGARIGFHAAFSAATGQVTGVGNALMGAYLNKIGLPSRAVIYISKASPNSMTWLDAKEATQEGIAVSIIGADKQITIARATPAASNPKVEGEPSLPDGIWNLGGSSMYLAAEGNRRKFFYESPRADLLSLGVRKDTMYFDGEFEGENLRGIAHVFVRNCPPLGYRVTGKLSNNGRQITLRGNSPQANAECQIVSERERAITLVYEGPRGARCDAIGADVVMCKR
jgi:hypothetical protein